MTDQDRDDPTVWLLLLERGRRTCDFELAARAMRELARLGIRVTYGRPKREGSRFGTRVPASCWPRCHRQKARALQLTSWSARIASAPSTAKLMAPF
jgi:hypothetical protein